MPELPEIFCRAREMNEYLTGRTIASVEVKQPKCLNVPVETFMEGLRGNTLGPTTYHGKWLLTELTQGHLLVNLGMGGELLLVDHDVMPEKWRVRIDFCDGKTFAVNFWWFGSTHYVAPGALAQHQQSAKLGPNALDLTADQFQAILAGRRGRIKSFLLDQSNLAGIGNAYIHDILFRAGIHPSRSISTLGDRERHELFLSIRTEFERSIEKGAAQYELNLLGGRGEFGVADLLVGYREGKPCPTCAAEILKVKTGSTTSYICPKCQVL
ncbi:Fpg/Nei family DNA glycosylase [Candidatus Bipolaricaulota bacterium]|nr:Fpg/Nei family DNA glycosylase [Candidatus Bipolaricaulota bacterium]